MVCLDTNAVIIALNPSGTHIRARLARMYVDRVPVGIPSIVLHELWCGIKNSARPRVNAAAMTTFLAEAVTHWPFDAEDAEEAGDIRATLRRAGTPIGPYDVLIAGQARRRGATLVTANEREFIRVPGLKIENWTRV